MVRIHRKVLAQAFPKENNQSISVRLGSMWKAMPADHKTVYFQAAKAAAAEHKRLHPCETRCNMTLMQYQFICLVLRY